MAVVRPGPSGYAECGEVGLHVTPWDSTLEGAR
jgi:hypothetical protein